MKHELNKELRSTGIIVLIALLSVCTLVTAPLWSGKSKDIKEIAMRRAESLAYQIIEIQKSRNSMKNEGRGPASFEESETSEGRMGMDPWGQPYQYKVVKNNNNHRVFVWSLGPPESKDNLSNLGSNQEIPTPDFKSDDIGVAVDFK